MFPYLDNIWPISLDLRGRAFSKNRVCDTTTTGLNNAILIYNKTISHVYVEVVIPYFRLDLNVSHVSASMVSVTNLTSNKHTRSSSLQLLIDHFRETCNEQTFEGSVTFHIKQ